MKTILTLSILLLTGGCATCRNHPIACTVAATVVAGSIAATAYHYSEHDRRRPTYGPCKTEDGVIGCDPIALP